MANPEDLGRYRLKRLLGRGALGQVWEADDLEHEGAKVAVKIMHAADEELAFARTLFARDAQLASLVNHPHVAAVHDAGEAAGTSFMVMEMVEGRTLRAALHDPATTKADKLRWLREVGEALAAMHRFSLAHRDLKPENVIVRPDGSACLVDLGIAKWFRVEGMETHERWPIDAAYVPPETADGLYDELSDQYAWGALGYEMFAVAGETTSDGAQALADLPAEAAEAIERARSPVRTDRWGTMARALARLSEARLSEPRPSGDPPESEPPPADPPGATAEPSAPPEASEPHPAAKLSPVALGFGALVLLALVVVVLAALR